MNAAEPQSAIYDFWLGLLPQFFAQLGVATPAIGNPAAAPSAIPFPADQIAKAASMTQNALQGLAQAYAPMLQAAGPSGLLAQWAAAMPQLPGMQAMQSAMGAMQNRPAAAAWPSVPSLSPGMDAAAAQAALASAALPFQQMQQAWLELGSQLVGGSAQSYSMAFDRTYGALSDALGFGPMRKLQAATQELMVAAAAQNEARASYLMVVQRAFASGLDTLLQKLAGMAERGERIDSVLALLRLWAQSTEEAVHEALQSSEGLSGTAAVARTGLAYRRKLQHIASLLADTLAIATRHDLDEAYREIQDLKRELRAVRAPVAMKATTRERKSTRNAK